MPVPDLAISAAIVCDLVRQLHHITKDNDTQIHALEADLASLKSLFGGPATVRATPSSLGGDALPVGVGGAGVLPPIPSDLTARAAQPQDDSTLAHSHTNATTTAASSASPSAVGSPTMISRDGPMPLQVDVPDPAVDPTMATSKTSAEASTETSTAEFVASTAVQTSPKDASTSSSNNDTTPLLPTLPVPPPTTASQGTQVNHPADPTTPSGATAASSAAADLKESAVQTRNIPDPQIAALKKDNAALMSTLKEYESTLELIMTKFRAYALSTQNEKKLLAQDHAKQLDQERLAAQSHALTNVQLAQQLERAHMAIRASLQASAEDDAAVLEELAATQAEAKTLRDVVAVHEETKKFYQQVDRFLAEKAGKAGDEQPPRPPHMATSQEPLETGPTANELVVSPKDDQPLEPSALPNPHSPPTHPLPLDASSTPLASATHAPAPNSPPSHAVAADTDPTPVLSPRDLAPPPPSNMASEASPSGQQDPAPVPSSAQLPLEPAAVPPPPVPAAAVIPPPPPATATNPLTLGGNGSLSMSRSTSNPFLQSTLGATAGAAGGTPPLGLGANPLLGPLATSSSFVTTATTETAAAGTSAAHQDGAGDWGDWSEDLGVPLDTGAADGNK